MSLIQMYDSQWSWENCPQHVVLQHDSHWTSLRKSCRAVIGNSQKEGNGFEQSSATNQSIKPEFQHIVQNQESLSNHNHLHLKIPPTSPHEYQFKMIISHLINNNN